MTKVMLLMEQKEIMEARRAGIPEDIIGKMVEGYDLTELERNIVKGYGKVYVLGHVKYKGVTKVRPQLRNLPIDQEITTLEFIRKRIPKLTVEEEKIIEEELEEMYAGYYDDELEGDVLEATGELEDLGVFDDEDVELFSENSDMITVMIKYLKEKEDEADGD